MSPSPIKRFSFPAESDDFEENIEERLTNRVKDPRILEKMNYRDDFSATTVMKTQQLSEPKSGSFQPKTVASNTNIFNPNNYEDAQKIADEILAGNSAIVNLEHLLSDERRRQDAIRIIDFLCGVAYAIKIEVKRVNAATFLFTIK